MKSLDNYEIWNQAFFHLGAKGSPHNEPFSFSLEQFFVKGLNFCLKGARTFSAFSYWVEVYGKNKLNPQEVIKQLELNPDYNPALLGFYLDIINNQSFSDVYSYAKKNDKVIVLHKVSNPDPILLKWGIYSKPMAESAEKYLVLDLTKNRIF